MTVENPYRAAGAFAGKAYIRREADAELVEQIRDNQYFPYFAAPRQSGKSSLIARTMASLPAPEFRCALVDLSPFVVRSYDDFWRQFLHEVARSANFEPTVIESGDPRDVFKAWLTSYPGRLVVFVDEIDVLLHVECREQIFSKIRTFFNLRAHDPALRRLTFVLAGAAHSSRFISDPRWSPFNVAIEIALEDLTSAQVSQLASYLGTAGAFAGPDLVSQVFEVTGGSVFLCQLVFEALWNRAARGKKKLDASDVDAVVASIVAESPRNIHFYNIFRLVTQDARLAMLFRRLVDGEELGEEDRKELQLTGLCRGMNPFRNDVYARVFGAGGPLDLKVAGAKVTLGRKLEAALVKRQQLEDEGQPTSQVEAEIAALRRELREGAQLREGDVLGRGRYRLVRQIGQGGFATVWQARDERAGREIALKVLHGQFAEDKSRRDRFFRGAWKMSELKHPAIVQVFEPYGEEGGRYFFVMEYMPGGTLHEAVLDKKMTADAVIAGIVAVGQALAHAHAHGLVHRDIKPSNVLLGADGVAKLTDFDLVREQDAARDTRTGPMGSFIYSAPEVLNRPQDADHRADVYGLAMTAVFGLHGAELPLDVVRDADRFIDRLRLGGLVKDVLKKGVAWEIERRFASAAEFTQALATAWADKEVEAAATEERGDVTAWAAMFVGGEEDGAAAAPAPPSAREAAPPAAVAAGAVAVGAAAMLAARSAGAPPAGAPAPGASAMTAGPGVGAASTMAAGASAGATAAGSTTQLDMAEGPPTAAGELATQVSRTPTGVDQERTGAVVVMQPTQDKPRRGVFAALGLFAAAALVLLALQINKLGVVSLASDPALEIHGASGQPQRVVETKKDHRPARPPTPEAHEKGDKPAEPTTLDDAKRPDPAQTSDTGEVGDASAGTDDSGEAGTTGGPTAIESETRTGTTTGTQAQNDPPRAPESGDTKGATTKKPSLAERIDEGCIEVKVGNTENGVRALSDAFDDSPRNVKLLGCLAQGMDQLANYTQAEHFYQLLLQQSGPRNKTALLGLAQVNEKMARKDRAAKYYEQVLALDPDNRSARAFFARNAGGQAHVPTTPRLDLEYKR